MRPRDKPLAPRVTYVVCPTKVALLIIDLDQIPGTDS